MMGPFTLIGACLFFATAANCQTWQDPYYSDAGTKGITTDIQQRYADIRMDEELPLPIRLIIVNYPGDVTVKWAESSQSEVDIKTQKEGDKTVVYINNRQDYENPKQRLYRLNVYAGDGAPGIIAVGLNNILDNEPTLVDYEGTCRAEELKENFNTNCMFTVEDLDGLTNNEITMIVSTDQNANQYFQFRKTDQLSEYRVRFALYVIKALDYEDHAFFNFETKITDKAGNYRIFKTMVEVIDVPNLPPKWIKPFATATFPEKTAMKFQVEAIDGDRGINQKIFYRVEFNDGNYGDFIKMEKETGDLIISPIDRDALQKQTFAFTIIAYKSNNYNWAINSSAMIVVEDINDNYPEIIITPSTVKLLEATYSPVEFNTFEVNDIDLGDNASYNVSLSTQDNINYGDAFNIVPSTGYQKSAFTMTVRNSTSLDYEDENWRSFQLEIKSQELKEPTHFRIKVIKLELINWNDEAPIFETNDDPVKVKETIGKGVAFARVYATDRDVGDKVRHKLVGSVRDLEIDPDTGIIKTTAKDTFDYERQTTVMVQVEASDTLTTLTPPEKLHTTFAQLTINVEDVNDETPEIRMPMEAPSIKENSPPLTEVTRDIQGKDLDTTANLVFEILWDETYATKSGMMADEETYRNCFIIQKSTGGSRNEVYGKLMVNPNFQGDIDYEKYEIIYLKIKLTDLNQEVNSNSTTGTLTIRIEDVNDNPPKFINGTLTQARSVVEKAPKDYMIGTIVAEDIDGPKYNKISYFIKPRNKKTPLWVKIDQKTGVISVKDDEVIDCDDPKIFDLEYDVRASDGELESTGKIKIRIIDTNNKIPQITPVSPNPIKKYENITYKEPITTIEATDIDRDAPYNVVSYAIDFITFPELTNYFEIDEVTGEIIAGTKVFDRDAGKDIHTVHINVVDNFRGSGVKNQNSTQFVLQLLDVNDNYPEMPDASDLNFVASEALERGIKIGKEFVAPDKDDFATPNAWVQYEILEIKPIGDNSEKLEEGSYDQLFTIQPQRPKVSAQVYSGKALRGFYGDWNITIKACDNGDMWDSRVKLCSELPYTVQIQPYNFNTPKIVFPDKSSFLRLRYEGQLIGQRLITYEGSPLKAFEAEDDDGGQYGNLQFEIGDYGANDDASFFEIIPESRNKSRLQITKEIDTRTYRVTLRATDSEKEDVIDLLKIVFVDSVGDPTFEEESMQTNFTEHWFNETRLIFEANDPKNEGAENEEERYKIYYYIDTGFNPEDAKFFELNKTSRELRVIKDIDREEQDFFRIKVIASNSDVKPLTTSAFLYVNITINDINDKPPKFEHTTYSGGITTNDYAGKQIVTVHANDPDLDDIIGYELNLDDIEAHGNNIESIKKTVFSLNKVTGVLYLAKTLISEMNGYFSFPIKAYDAVRHEDTCNVKVYIVSESNRVQYLFSNDYTELMENADFLRSKLQELYEYEACNIDDIARAEPRADNNQSTTADTFNAVTVHFINNSEAVKASDIEERNNDVVFIRTLKTALREHSLFLEKLPEKENEPTKTMENLLVTILGVVTGVLSVLCVVLVVAFVMKTRRLNKQIEAFAPPDFGSTSSNLNRIGVPTSNIFSVEGSNPVLNNNQLQKDVFDTQSIDSDESDFAGINTDPNFIMEPSERRISEMSASTENTDYTYKNSILSVTQLHNDDFGSEKF